MNSDTSRVLTTIPNQATRLFNASTGVQISDFGVSAAQFSPDGSHIVVASADEPGAALLDSNTGKVIKVFKQESVSSKDSVGALAEVGFSADGTRIIAAGDSKAMIWDLTSWHLVNLFNTEYPTRFTRAKLSADGTRLVARGDKADWLWDVQSGKLVQLLLHPQYEEGRISMSETSTQFSPDGHFLLTAYDDARMSDDERYTKIDRVRVWDAHTGELVGALAGHTKAVNDARFNADGTRIVTASNDGTARIWDPRTLEQVCLLKGHDDEVRTAEFSPDGMRVVTSSKDRTARLWNVMTCSELGIVGDHRFELFSAFFDKQGIHLLTTSGDAIARLWSVPPSGKDLIALAEQIVPRCLTPEERESASLTPEPPDWCIDLQKLPYNTSAWKEWLDQKRSNKNVPMPRDPMAGGRIDVSRADAYRYGGAQMLDHRDYSNAITILTEAIQLDSKNASAYNSRGRGYSGEQEYHRAIVDYDEAIRLDPKYLFAYIGRGLAYYDTQQYGRAILDFDQAIQLDPEYPLAYFWRGLAYFENKDDDRAILDYDEAIQFDPKYAIAFHNRGLAYRAKGENDRAIVDYTEAIRLNPKNALAFNDRGFVYHDKGDDDRAVADFNEAIRLDPATAARQRGSWFFYQGDFEKAAADLLRANDLRVNAYTMLWLYLARAHMGQDGVAVLSASATQLKSKDWPHAVIAFYLGQRSLDEMRTGARKPNEKCEFAFYAGEWELLRGNRGEAKASLQVAADTCPRGFLEYNGAISELKRLGQ
jgi:WD40 repeat protein